MAKKYDTAKVKIQLLCAHCGENCTANPGDVIEVDAEEAERLIGLKAAVAYAEPTAETA